MNFLFNQERTIQVTPPIQQVLCNALRHYFRVLEVGVLNDTATMDDKHEMADVKALLDDLQTQIKNREERMKLLEHLSKQYTCFFAINNDGGVVSSTLGTDPQNRSLENLRENYPHCHIASFRVGELIQVSQSKNSEGGIGDR